ncbi:Integral peroxisomal membrane peroxin [Cordyceps fumosorosea ARSEF 2679]|uniref:Integral peroxisomal membrane peroxin n=1 Tax=Cordyceps fumosorosea (strain ARSEF 2679) TaxID=1081104 RepID=A0A167R489_CORFA|nr:Integral peroxisomal membrane peroxin [Cordyceps fumosorosea ARSEF 2679]OAA58258.1 Integral peroxisomal membrane peroxin [Cordyceps fumosorosea ARSEF 2679]
MADTPKDDSVSAATDNATPTQRYGLFGGLAALRERANIQDRLVERLLAQVMPAEDGEVSFTLDEDVANAHRAPEFSLGLMSYNFRRFNARAGVLFQLQDLTESLLEWQRPSQTLALLAVYTLLCLDPHLVVALPPALLVLAVLVPSFLARHPAPPRGTLSSDQGVGYSAAGPPLAPPVTVAPVRELSRDFVKNMRRLQNQMGGFVTAHDLVVEKVLPLTNFSDEALSSAVFLSAVGAILVATTTAHLVPWRFVFLAGGWAHVCAANPYVVQFLADLKAGKFGDLAAAGMDKVAAEALEGGDKARTFADGWVAADIILDSAPETREVEIFELQRKTGSGEWEPWVFCPSPYDPLSAPRIAGDRPGGTRFFEDVAAPDGWEWSEKKWALDLWSREWVEERIITGVEVETEGERWVYDMYDEAADDALRRSRVVENPDTEAAKNVSRTTSWEEGEDGAGLKGEWRRRRWVRLVKRKTSLVEYS